MVLLSSSRLTCTRSCFHESNSLHYHYQYYRFLLDFSLEAGTEFLRQLDFCFYRQSESELCVTRRSLPFLFSPRGVVVNLDREIQAFN